MSTYHGVPHFVGNTPLIRLRRLSELTGCEILGKAEFMNPGGSVKDRAGLAIIEAAEADLKGESPRIVVDGWNVAVSDAGSSVPVTLNVNAQVDHWPVSGLPIVAHTWK